MRKIRFWLAAIAVLLCSVPVSAHNFEVDGVYYNITSETDLTVEVTYEGLYYYSKDNEYTGEVVIPKKVTYNKKNYSVTSIGYSAFEGCSGLTSITIPNSVTSIGSSAFIGCSSLEELYISSSVTSIGDNLLAGCRNLNTLTVGAKIPPAVNDLGLGSQQYFTVKLQVPEGSKAMYQFADAWKKFFNIEEFDPATGIADITPDAEDKNLPIYNLQGARMTADRENLPTGIYIQGGKKIFIK